MKKLYKVLDRAEASSLISKQASKQYLYVTNQKNPHTVTKGGVFPQGKMPSFFIFPQIY